MPNLSAFRVGGTIGGTNNTEICQQSHSNTTTTWYNIAVGDFVGSKYNRVAGNNLTPSNSVDIGNGASAMVDAQTNQIVIGDSAIGSGSLGNTTIITHSSQRQHTRQQSSQPPRGSLQCYKQSDG